MGHDQSDMPGSRLAARDFAALWRKVMWFFVPLVIFWGLSVFWWADLGYHGTFRWMNGLHLDIVDSAALYVFTHFGDGLILPAIMLLFFWRKDPGLAVTAVIAVLLTGLLTQIGKNVVFTDWQRPPKIFALEEVVRIVHPDPPGSRSFPSGHATSIATGGIFFVYFMSEWKRWLPFFIGIFTVGLCFTRVIIGVHFPGDIFVGSMIGSVGGLVLLHYLTPFFRKRLSRFENNASYKVNMAVAFIAAAVILAQYLQLLINT